MRTPLVLAAAIVLIGAASLPAASAEQTPGVTQTESHHAISAAKRKKRVRAHQAYGSSGQQIACTQFGCNPIPRGCQVVPGRNPFTWNPSGFDEVRCPYYR